MRRRRAACAARGDGRRACRACDVLRTARHSVLRRQLVRLHSVSSLRIQHPISCFSVVQAKLGRAAKAHANWPSSFGTVGRRASSSNSPTSRLFVGRRRRESTARYSSSAAHRAGVFASKASQPVDEVARSSHRTAAARSLSFDQEQRRLHARANSISGSFGGLAKALMNRVSQRPGRRVFGPCGPVAVR